MANTPRARTSRTHVSTGLVLDLDFQTRATSVRSKLWNPDDIFFAQAQGGYQDLPNGHVLLQHGTVPIIEEYDSNGACVMTARFGLNNVTMSYRGYRSLWVGTPKTKPDVVACREEDSHGRSERTAVYVSWNGATDVQAWKVYAGHDKKVEFVKTVAKNGFETRIEIDGNLVGRAVMVQAVGGPNGGKQSEIVSVGAGC